MALIHSKRSGLIQMLSKCKKDKSKIFQQGHHFSMASQGQIIRLSAQTITQSIQQSLCVTKTIQISKWP